MSRRRPSSCKQEVAVYMPATSEDDECVMKSEGIRPMHAEMQHMIESALHVFQVTTLDRRIEATVEKKVFIFLKIPNMKLPKTGRSLFNKLSRRLYAEILLEAPLTRLCTSTSITLPSRIGSWNTSRRTLSRNHHSQCISPS